MSKVNNDGRVVMANKIARLGLGLTFTVVAGRAATAGGGLQQRGLTAFQFVPSRGVVVSSTCRQARFHDTQAVWPSPRPPSAAATTPAHMSVAREEKASPEQPMLRASLEGRGDASALAAAGPIGGGGAVPHGLQDVASAVAESGGGAAKRVAEALPGTWMAAGLPKWVHTMRRRLITKEDYLHLHAVSGVLYLLGGSLWLINVMGIEIFAGVPQLETNTAMPLLVLGAGLVNTISAIPMANTRSWVLTGLCVSLIQLWQAWYVSGAYPASLAPADPWLAAASLTVLVIGAVEAEEMIASEARAKELVRASGRKWRRSGRTTMHAGDDEEGVAINRFGSYANFAFNAPHLYATLVGGGWLERLAAAYPSSPALLFHAYFALAAGSSLALLAPTLYSRRLIDAKGMSAMQFLTAAPLITSLVDAAVMGSAATNNPLEIYLGFLS